MAWWRKLVRREWTAEEFWAWFSGEAETYRAADFSQRQDLIQAFGERLKRVDHRLAFQMSAEREGIRAVEISADGINALAPKVREVVAAAPELPGWRVLAFRQPVVDEVSIRFGDAELDWRSVRYISYPHSPGMLDVALYVDGLTPETHGTVLGAVFLLLDALLGEETVIERLDGIESFPLTEAPAGHRPLIELRDEVSRLG